MNRIHRRRRQALVLVAAASLLAGGLAAAAGAAPAAKPSGKDRAALKVANAAAIRSDKDQGHVQKETWDVALAQQAQRDEAFQRKLQGKKPYPKGSSKSKRVPLEIEGTDRVFVILAEFGNQRHPSYCDDVAVEPPAPQPCASPSDGTPQQYDGPLHNQIPAPDRSIDNSTLWQADYDRAHYQDMYFNRMKEYYEHQSSGRYSIDGDVTEWVTVPFNQARYGRDFCGSIVCTNTWNLLRDAMGIWVQDRLDEGMTMPEINAYLKTFDIEDRYDINGNGNFREPDGVIDHFQIVHAGGDQAAGDPAYGSDAIWSHRWRAEIASGPGGIPGFQIGSSGGLSGLPTNLTDMWVADYTIQPENGGLGVFAHEYGHDLGLPDLYDTSGNTGGGENSTAFWSLMSSGANIGDGGRDGIGDAPTDLDAWSKLYLGWMDAQGSKGPFYKTVEAGEDGQVRLSDNDTAMSDGYQAMIVNLPDNVVETTFGDPPQGDFMWYSGQGGNLENTMTRTVPATSGTLTAQLNYAAEAEYDYIYVEASADGTTFAPVDTTLSDHPGHAGHDPDGNNPTGFGITGSSGDAWVTVSADLPDGTTAVRIRYSTDPSVNEFGVLVDDVKIDGVSIGTAENETEGWTLAGFTRTNGVEVNSYYNAYIVENRQYDDYDESLKTAYNFGFLNTNRPDWVETHPYQDGALIWYLNDEFNGNGDFSNDVADHPGEGFLLPVDAHPQFSHWPDGTLMRPRILSADSTFGYEKTKRALLHNGGVAGFLPSYRGQPVFNDTLQWWFNADPHGATGAHPGRYQPGWYSVDVPKTGTIIKVLKPRKHRGGGHGHDKHGDTMDIAVYRD